MIDMVITSLQVRFTVFANRLIHFLLRVPFIKRVLSPSLYGQYSLKTGFTVCGVIIRVIKKVLFRFFYVTIIAAIGFALWQAAARGGLSGFFDRLASGELFMEISGRYALYYILTVWFFFSFTGACTSAWVIDVTHNDQDNTMVNYLRVNPTEYAKSQILLVSVVDIILYLPYLLIAFAFSGIPLWATALMLILFAAFRLLGEALNLLTYRHIGKHFGDYPLTLVSLVIIALAIGVPILVGVPDWSAVVQNPFVALGAVAAGTLAWLYIARFPYYGPIIKARISKIEIAKSKAKGNTSRQVGINLKSVKNWNEGIDNEELKLDKHSAKTGFSYLNAIFFDRHSKFFKKKLYRRLTMIVAAGVLVSVFGTAYRVITGNALMSNEAGAAAIFNTAPIFFFLIYLISMGRVVTAGVFSNCDIQMLHYSYYRTRETILASFKTRFLFILRYNILITTALALAVIAAISSISWQFFSFNSAIFFILMTCTGLFFAFNDLFLYYVIQPYDSAGQTKSITCSVINIIIYIIAYAGMQINFSFISYSLAVIFMTIVYLGIGTALLSRYAPRNFKLK